MIRFVIVADLRTGSTLLSSSLHAHPEVCCRGELLHSDDFPDNGLPGVERPRETGRALVRRAFEAGPEVKAAGFRAMVFLPLPERPQWADAWDALAAIPDLRVIYLERRDVLAQYASVEIANLMRVWHPSPGDPVLEPSRRPRITIDPDALERWAAERAALFRQRREQLADKASLDLDYETLTGDWLGTMQRVQAFLDVTPILLPQRKQKQEVRPLAEVITNYEQLEP